MRASIPSRISEGRRRSGAESMVQRFSEQVASLAEGSRGYLGLFASIPE